MSEQAESERQIARIEVDREICIGAGSCVALTPEVFSLDQANKAVVNPAYAATDEMITNAAKSCPVAAIYLYNRQGRRLYPDPV